MIVHFFSVSNSKWDGTFPISWTLSTRNSSLFINGDICANGKKTSSHIHKRTTLYCGRTLGKVIFRCFFLYLTSTIFFFSLSFLFIENIYATLPRTQRGQPIVLGSDPKGKNFLYCNGNSVIIRNIDVSLFHMTS